MSWPQKRHLAPQNRSELFAHCHNCLCYGIRRPHDASLLQEGRETPIVVAIGDHLKNRG
jgi:hypothetical protein